MQALLLIPIRMEIPINYIAVIVAAIAQMALGFVWYGPLFGKEWSKLMGWSEAEMAVGRAKMEKEGWKTYSIQALGALIMSYILAHYFIFASTYTNTHGLLGGFVVGFWSWLGFVAPVMLSSVLWEGKSWKLFFLQSGYYLVALIVMGMIIGYSA